MSNMFAAKRAIFDAMKVLAVPGGPLAPAQVEYSWRAGLGPIVIYGGGVRFDQPGEEDVTDGNDVAFAETASVAVQIQVEIPLDSLKTDDPIREADVTAERFGRVIGRMLVANPRLCGPNTAAAIRSGTSFYTADDTKAISTLALRIDVESFVDYQEE